MRLWWSVFCVVLSGCVSPSVMKEALYPELAELELYRHGGEIFCAEPVFLACADMSAQVCSEEGRRYTHDCIVSIKAAQGDITGQAGASEMIERFSACMADRMLSARDRPAVEQCMEHAARQ